MSSPNTTEKRQGVSQSPGGFWYSSGARGPVRASNACIRLTIWKRSNCVHRWFCILRGVRQDQSRKRMALRFYGDLNLGLILQFANPLASMGVEMFKFLF